MGGPWMSALAKAGLPRRCADGLVLSPTRKLNSSAREQPGILLVVDVEDIAIGVLEPGRLELSDDMHIAIASEPGRVRVFEWNARRLKGPHDRSSNCRYAA
jgi:hypothetical protein